MVWKQVDVPELLGERTKDASPTSTQETAIASTTTNSENNTMSGSPPTPQINLLRGWPATDLLPAQLLKAGAQRVLSSVYEPPEDSDQIASRPIDYGSLSLAERALLYGPDPGHFPLRKQLSMWLASFYGPATVQRYRTSKRAPSSPASPPSPAKPSSPVKSSSPAKSRSSEEYSISPSRITITGGASQSVGVIMSALTDPTYTRNIWLVAPAYFLVFRIFEDAGFGFGRMRAVPELRTKDKEGRGPDVAWLRKEMEKAERDFYEKEDSPKLKPPSRYPKIYKHVIYTVPSFSNPSSITTSVSVREELVRCARDFDALIICDDVYDSLQWHANPLTYTASSLRPTAFAADWPPGVNMDLDVALVPRVVDVERALFGEMNENDSDGNEQWGNVISNGTFSKICAPGCRVGWVEASPRLAHQISQAGTSKSGGCPGHVTSTFITSLLETGEMQRHIREVLRPSYARRYHSLTSAVRRYLEPLGVSLPAPHNLAQCDEDDRAGGYFLWLALPPRCPAADVVSRCMEEQNLIIAGGKIFEVPGDDDESVKFGSDVRLCFSWENEENLMEGVKRLAKVVEAVIKEGPRPATDAVAAEKAMRRLQDLDKGNNPYI